MLKRIMLALALVFCLPTVSAFELKDTQGKMHTLMGYKGKWVLVNFWATWCPPCLDEIPDLVALHEDKKNNLVVIGIAMDYRDSKTVTQFADNMMISYPIVLGNPRIAGEIGPVQGLPTTYLYNPQGKMVAYNVGPLTKAAVQGYIRRK
jgi:thiol-disulfide isomerase/thioredoxin